MDQEDLVGIDIPGHLVMIMKKMAAEWTSLQKQLPAP